MSETEPPSDPDREVTGRHQLDPHDRLDVIERSRAKERGRGDTERWIVRAAIAALGGLAIAIGSHIIAAEQSSAVADAEHDRRIVALEERVSRSDAQWSAITEQLSGMREQLAAQTEAMRGLSARLERIEERLDGARR